jgi:hypothetical protein
MSVLMLTSLDIILILPIDEIPKIGIVVRIVHLQRQTETSVLDPCLLLSFNPRYLSSPLTYR